jgi:hypothetical protein
MSLYGTSQLASIEEAANSPAILESFFVDDLIRMKEEDVKKFCESAECKILTEKQVLKKPTLMRLSKVDDERRRTKLIAYKLAKDANDPEWEKFKKYTALRKQSIQKIMRKYGNRAAKIAKIAQKNYISTASKIKATEPEKK